MKSKFSDSFQFVAAGSLTAVVILLVLVPFTMGGCNPANLDVQSLIKGGTQVVKSQELTEQDEDAIGQSVALTATNRWRVSKDQKLNRYVTLVARVIVASSDDTHIKPNVAVLDTEEVNAFSAPHGYIFITRGAMERIHDESELAGVLAHEVGHLAKHHGLNALKTAGTESGFLTMVKGNVKQVQEFGNYADTIGDAIINKGFLQPQEEEADALAVQYVIAAGYDPNGFLHFLQRLQQEQGNGGNPFGTHPGIGDRIQKVSAQIAASGAGGQGATLADRFHRFAVK